MRGVIATVLLVTGILSYSAGCDSNPDEQAVQQQAPPVQSFNTGNPTNDKLLALPQSEQASVLGTIAGAGCVGNRAFYMGMFSGVQPGQTKKEQQLAAILQMDHSHSAFWSVGCTNGASYEVEISVDDAGSTKVVDCSVLKAVAHSDCFVRFKNQ